MQYTSKTSHISAKRFVGFNNILGHLVGVSCALVLADLEDQIDFYKEESVSHEKYGDGWVYTTIETMQKRTCLTKHEQDTAIKKLVSLGLLEVKVFGMPPKRYFRLNGDKINELCGVKVTLLNCRKPEISNHNLKESTSPQGDEIKNKSTNFPETGNCFPENRKYGLISINTNNPDNNTDKNTYAPSCDSAADPSASLSSQTSPKPKTPSLQPFPNITVSQVEHDKLVKKFGADLVQEGYEDMSEWKESACPKQVAKHKSDYYRLRKWGIPDLIKKQHEADRYKQSNIAPHRRNSKLVTPGDLEGYDGFKMRSF